jgi:hypothetical protein
MASSPRPRPGRTKGPGNDAQAGQYPLGSVDFPAKDMGRTEHDQIVVPVGVVADLVAPVENFPDQFGMGFRVFPGHEKGGPDPPAFQKVQQDGRGFRVRAVVEGQGHGALSGISPPDHRHEEAEARREGRGEAENQEGGERDGRQSRVRQRQEDRQRERGGPDPFSGGTEQ